MDARPQPVHVLHVVGTLGKGGGMETNLYKIVRGLVPRQTRHSIALLSDFPDIIDFGELARVHRVRKLRNLATAVPLAALIFRLSPTVIHVRNSAVWPDAALARFLGARHTPLIVSCHGSESAMVNASPARRLTLRRLARSTERLFAVSDAARHSAERHYGIPAASMGVIPNGVDTERFKPLPRAKLNPRLVIGALGRLAKVKNLPLLVRAFAEAVRRGLDAELRLGGTGSEKEPLDALIASLGLSDRIQLTGLVEDPPAFLSALDIFVLSSESEAHPNALLEAMACARPCIATSVGGVPEVLDDGRFGLMVGNDDMTAMCNAIETLAADPELRERLGASAREHVMARYRWATMLDTYESLYRFPQAVRP